MSVSLTAVITDDMDAEAYVDNISHQNCWEKCIQILLQHLKECDPSASVGIYRGTWQGQSREIQPHLCLQGRVFCQPSVILTAGDLSSKLQVMLCGLYLHLLTQGCDIPLPFYLITVVCRS